MKHRMARITGGWNYRGYCVNRKHKGNAGCRWEMADEDGEWRWFFNTLDEFRLAVNKWCRQNAVFSAAKEKTQ